MRNQISLLKRLHGMRREGPNNVTRYVLAKLYVEDVTSINISSKSTVKGSGEDVAADLAELLRHVRQQQYLQAKTPKDAQHRRAEYDPCYRYKVCPLKTGIRLTQKGGSVGGEIHFPTTLPPNHLREHLKVAYNRLEAGMAVEFHLHPRVDQPDLSVDWALRYMPHLRPDVILQSMPEETAVIVPPVVNCLRANSLKLRREYLPELIWAFSTRQEDQRAVKKVHEAGNAEISHSERMIQKWTRGFPAFEDATRLAKELMKGNEHDFLDSNNEMFREARRKDLWKYRGSRAMTSIVPNDKIRGSMH